MFVRKSLGTHDGTFHADEVTAAALLVCFDLVDRANIIRTRNLSLLDTCEFVCDVGGEYAPVSKKFDHHQASYRGDLSSAGMVWLYLQEIGVVSQELYEALNHNLIQGVDAHDNGVSLVTTGMCTFSHIISNFMPVHYSAVEEELDRAFFDAVDFVIGHIQRFVERFAYVQQSREKVRLAMAAQTRVLFFTESLPWLDLFFSLGGEKHPAQFVIMPSGEHWKLRGIPPTSQERMKVRVPLPKQWAGLLEEDLKKISGIEGAVFCHKGRFISVWKTQEDARKAVEYVLQEEGSK